ncbi:TPA: hypothetical protein EYO12_03115 [Candidatus Saccharibacteria bacterium]|nr:hypothetical protein [Candidatus Saccharibacteria bacterium]HIO87976.1 hypothetical protein [Candidatus Saccharibacteria bacterium]
MRSTILNIDPSETVDFEVRRHPVGLIPIYGSGVFIIALLIGIALLARSSGLGADFPDFFKGAMFLMVVFAVSVLVAIGTYIAARIYRTNELIVTSENLVQILQTSLFSSAVSQLSLEKVQDVTAIKRGFFASVFNFGTIQVETAGETANFAFRLAKDPVVAAKQINEAHEKFIKKYGIDVI